MNYHAPLNSCPISCLWIYWTSVLMGLKLSSYLEIFQPVIMKFFSLFSFFHFLWDFIYIYFSILKVISNFCDAQLIFPTVFSFLFSMSLFNILNILQLHECKDYYSRKHFNALPANYVMYILTVFLLIDFSLIMDIFLLLFFFFPFPSFFFYFCLGDNCAGFCHTTT